MISRVLLIILGAEQECEAVGRNRYNSADRLLITADGGGSNGSRVRLWEFELQKLADETGLTMQVCHYPPGTSKWNKIKHRMFRHIPRPGAASRWSADLRWSISSHQPPQRPT